jgi:hypothetical protein
MKRWTIKRSSLFILASVIFIMLVIVVLPFVDLLDTAFHRGTAPIAVHAQATSAPTALSTIPAFQQVHTDQAPGHLQQPFASVLTSDPNFLPILLHSLRR